MAQLDIETGLSKLGSRAQLASIALLAATVAYGGQGIGLFLEYAGLANLAMPEPDPITLIVILVSISTIPILIVSIILVSMWIYRGHDNLRAAGFEKEFSPGWAVGWYFVPFANFVMPFRAMRELWNLSHRESDDIHAVSAPQLTQWWGFWIGGNILSTISSRMSQDAGGPAFLVMGGGSLLLAAAAWWLRSIITEVTSAQRSMVGIEATFA